MSSPQKRRFLDIVLDNPVNARIVERAPELGFSDWYLTAGAVFQSVWNHQTGRDPGAGVSDYDVFYFDGATLDAASEQRVITRAAELFGDVGAPIDVRNEARVHLWYEEEFGTPGVRFHSCEHAIDHFASTTCCFGVTTDMDGIPRVYAPHGFDDLFDMVVRPNPVLAPRAVYEAKAARWIRAWPGLRVEPWPT